jgi:hypothetical protein
MFKRLMTIGYKENFFFFVALTIAAFFSSVIDFRNGDNILGWIMMVVAWYDLGVVGTGGTYRIVKGRWRGGSD